MESFTKLKEALAELEADVKKTLGGNKMASVRVRNAMLEVKKLADAVRKEAMACR
jgi:hypothetical protein